MLSTCACIVCTDPWGGLGEHQYEYVNTYPPITPPPTYSLPTSTVYKSLHNSWARWQWQNYLGQRKIAAQRRQNLAPRVWHTLPTQDPHPLRDDFSAMGATFNQLLNLGPIAMARGTCIGQRPIICRQCTWRIHEQPPHQSSGPRIKCIS